MRWMLRDGARQLVLSTDRAAPFAGAILIEDPNAAAYLLRNMSYDPANMKLLRQMYDEFVGSHDARSRADTLILAELMGRVAAARLFAFEHGRQIVASYEPIEEDPVEWEAAEAIAAEPEPAAPQEPKASPAMIAQAQALQNAAQDGAPFCDE